MGKDKNCLSIEIITTEDLAYRERSNAMALCLSMRCNHLLIFFSLLAFFVSLQSSQAQEVEGKTSGCVQVAENPLNPGGDDISVCYRWLKPFDPSQKTFIFLVGGPGAAADYYLLFKEFWLNTTLGQKFNLLFFDPRGTGRSSAVDASNVANRDMHQYTLPNMTADVESLRKILVGDQSIGVIGHSTGAHQVFDYSIRFPDHVFSVISLHGGVSGLGFLMQTYYRLNELQKALAGIDQNKVAQLRSLIQSGVACNQDGSQLPASAWQQLANFALYGTVAQRKALPSIFTSLIDGNISSKKFCNSAGDRATTTLMPQIPANDPLNAMTGINPIINQNVVCSNFVTKGAVAALPTPLHDPTFNYIWEPQCLPLLSAGKIIESQFDVKASLSQIKAPILVLGADGDQWIPPSVQDEIWQNMSSAQTGIGTFVRLNQCGHFSFFECPDQLKAALDGFLK